MKRSSLLLMSLLALAGYAYAEEAQDEVSGNVGVVSQYRYRGISQSRGLPALQGGADFNSASGLYVGTWISTINWIKDSSDPSNNFNYTGSTETDIYGGYKFSTSYFDGDLGYLRYQYFGNNLNSHNQFSNPNTNELYFAVTTGVLTTKYSRSYTDLFGNMNSKGSTYWEVSANFELNDGYSIVPHVGRQTVANISALSYTDTSLTLNKEVSKGLVGNVTALTTNANYSPANSYYYYPAQPSYNPTKSTVVVGLKYNF